MKNIRLIGVAGLARSGKDTVTNMLAKHYDAYTAAFADPIKHMLEVGLGITFDELYKGDKSLIHPKYGVSLRHMMQSLATDWGRVYISDDVWIRAVESIIEGIGEGTHIVSDVRFEDEAAWVREHGMLIHVTGRGGIPGEHASESGVLIDRLDVVIDNSGSMAKLRSQINHIVESHVLGEFSNGFKSKNITSEEARLR